MAASSISMNCAPAIATVTPAKPIGPEEWRPIVGYSGYEVSSHGRIRSVRRLSYGKVYKGRILKPVWRYQNGRLLRLTVMLHCEGQPTTTFAVHELVARTFIGPRPPELETAHLDGDPSHNFPHNLAHCTHLENSSHTAVHGTRCQGERAPRHILTADEVEFILRNYKSRSKGRTAAALARRFGVHEQTIWSVLYGSNWRHAAPDVPRLSPVKRRANPPEMRGVYPERHRWKAAISRNGTRVYLGTFETVDQAKNAVAEARRSS